MRVLLTGGAGFIGSNIADLLLERGHGICIVDDFSTGRLENLPPDVLVREIGIGRSPTPLDQAFEYFKPEAVCHQAAQASLLYSYAVPSLDAETNIIGTINLIQSAKQWGVKRFVMASTMAVFPNHDAEPSELTAPAPQRPYGISKRAAEMYLGASGLSYAILRYGNVYGPRQRPVGENQVVARLFSHLYKHTDFAIYGDGHNTRDFVFVRDVAEANLRAIEGTMQGPFHIGTGMDTSVDTVVNYSLTWAGQDPLPGVEWHKEFIEHKPAIEEPEHLEVHSFRRRELGWEPVTMLRDGLRETDAWWRAQGN
jgi:UDP-glucose 4-epimerase